MAAHVLHQGLACCGCTAWAHRMGGDGGIAKGESSRGSARVGVSVWAAGEVGLWWTRAAPDETQPATRAKRAETDKPDGAPRWANHGASRPTRAGRLLLT